MAAKLARETPVALELHELDAYIMAYRSLHATQFIKLGLRSKVMIGAVKAAFIVFCIQMIIFVCILRSMLSPDLL